MSNPETCAYGDCAATDTAPRRMYDATTIMWYCEAHDPLQDPELAALWVEAEV